MSNDDAKSSGRRSGGGPAEIADTVAAEVADTVAAASEPGRKSSSQPQPERFVAGAIVGARYELLGQLGRGAHGAVFRAYDRHADEIVALKILTGVRDDYLALLRRELSAARRVTHRGVVRMYDLVEVEGGWALSMELVEGTSLADEMDRGPMAIERVRAIADALAEALATAHAADVVHRDLKPENILVRADGTPVISDFGISRVAGAVPPARPSSPTGGSVNLTVDGVLLGTPLYMSPEQLEGQTAVGPTADVYAFGLIVFEMLTGSVPHDADSLSAMQRKRLGEAAPSLEHMRADVPADLARVVDRCLARDPAARFADGGALLEGLRPKSKATSTRPPRPRPPSRGRAVALAAGLAALVAGAAFVSSRWRAPARPTTAPDAAPARARIVPINPRRVTFGALCEEYPAFLPDGKKLVFDATEGVKSNLYELDLDTGTRKRITSSPMWDYAAAVSPDGAQIAFLRRTREGVVSAILERATGEVRELIPGDVRPAFTPDGRAIWGGERFHPKLIALGDGKLLRALDVPEGHEAFRIRSASDGRVLGLFRSVGDPELGLVGELAPGASGWRTAPATSGQGTPNHFSDALALSPDGRGAIFMRSSLELATWVDGAVSPEVQGLTIKVETGLDLSRDGRRMTWSTCAGWPNLVAIEGAHFKPVVDAQVDWSNRDGAVLADGRLALVSDRGGSGSKLWLARPDGSESSPTALGNTSVLEVSAKGSVVVVSTDQGLRLVDTSTNAAPVALTNDKRDEAASIDLHGDVVFSKTDGDQLFRVSARGGPPVSFGPPGAVEPTASPNADVVVCVVRGKEGSTLMAVDPRGARPFGKGLAPGRYTRPTFSPDGREVAVVRDTDALVRIDAKSERVIEVRKVERGTIYHPVYGPKNQLYAIGTDWIGNVWMADVQ